MNILVTGAWQGYRECEEELHKLGHDTAFLQWEKDPLPVAAEWVEGIIGNGIFLNHPIEQFTNLKYIQLTSAGFDRVPMDYVKAHQITIYNARGVYSIPMAEYALSGVLFLYKQMAGFYASQKLRYWEKRRDILELCGKRVLIAGCGSVGNECAKRFQAFGCQVRGVDLYPREDEFYEKILPLDVFEEELASCDILITTLPLTDATYHVIDEKYLNRMKQSAVVVNISRGAVIDQQALTTALKEKKILGAVLDVFEEEPLQEESSLWQLENVLITPHNSFVGEKNLERLNRVILNNLK